MPKLSVAQPLTPSKGIGDGIRVSKRTYQVGMPIGSAHMVQVSPSPNITAGFRGTPYATTYPPVPFGPTDAVGIVPLNPTGAIAALALFIGGVALFGALRPSL